MQGKNNKMKKTGNSITQKMKSKTTYSNTYKNKSDTTKKSTKNKTVKSQRLHKQYNQIRNKEQQKRDIEFTIKELPSDPLPCPLTPEIQVYVPEQLTISPDVTKYIYHNTHQPDTQMDKNYATQIKIIDLEDTIKSNIARIERIEEKILNNQDQRKKCYMIGDSHFRDIESLTKNNEDLMKNFNVEVKFYPGKCLKDICQSIPQQMEDDSIIVISAGTNDLYKTDIDIFKQQIEYLANLKQRIILLSILPQDCTHTNQDIVRFNTKIKYLAKNVKNIEILNTHAFIKPQHLKDGIHLKMYAKEWILQKLTSMMINGKTNINLRTNYKYYNQYSSHKEYQQGNSGRWENGKFIQFTENPRILESGRWENGKYVHFTENPRILDQQWPALNKRNNDNRGNINKNNNSNSNDNINSNKNNYSRNQSEKINDNRNVNFWKVQNKTHLIWKHI
uniref:Uncharacterized protein n=1 Tax=Cacopsylla melanoneura TaxID=428564 RepID=A0A8D9ASU3_9HEMI